MALELSTEVDTGARNVDHVVRASLLPKIATGILERMTDDSPADKLVVGREGWLFFGDAAAIAQYRGSRGSGTEHSACNADATQY